MATLILDHLYEHVISTVVYCEVFYDSEISAEFPEHAEFIKTKLFPTLIEWGYEVIYVRSEKTFLDCFYHQRGGRSKNAGKIVGFMLSGHCDVQGLCKIKPMQDYLRTCKEYTSYVGIAADEEKRLVTAHAKGQVSLLEKYGITESGARLLCERMGLLSPIYKYFKRTGCWFCPNCSKAQLRYLYDYHRDLFEKLLSLEDTPNKVADTFCYGKTYHYFYERFQAEGKQLSLLDYLRET